jgi:hypothetical protein
MLWLFAIGSLISLVTPCWTKEPMYDQPVITLSGGIIAPSAPQEKIRMDLMQINICMQTGSYILDAVFHLFNTGETTTLWVGLPKHGWSNASLSADDPLIVDFIRLECWVNDRKEVFVENVSFMRDSSHLFPRPPDFRVATKWMAKEITFPENIVTIIRVRFEAPYNCCDSSNSPYDGGVFFFGPGQHWKSKISRAEVVLVNPDSDKGSNMGFVSPGTTLRKRITTEKEIKYEFRELMPNPNGYAIFGQRVYPIKKK